MERLWLIAALLCFLAGFGRSLVALGAGKFRPARFNLAMMLAGFGFQTVFLVARGRIVGGCPITNLFEVIVFLSWSIVLIYLLVGPAYRLSLMGTFTAPLVAGLLLFALLAPIDLPAQRSGFNNPWIEAHASLSLIAYGAFGLAAIASVMYLVQERQLKKRSGGDLLYNLPPISDLDTANCRLITTGFLMLTIAFASGFVAGLPVAELKFLASALVWVLYGGLWLLRRSRMLTPGRGAIASALAFTFTLGSLPAIQYLSVPHP